MPRGRAYPGSHASAARSPLLDHLRRRDAVHGADAARAGLRRRVRAVEDRRGVARCRVRRRRPSRGHPGRARGRTFRPEERCRLGPRTPGGREPRVCARRRRCRTRHRSLRPGLLEHRHLGGRTGVGRRRRTEGEAWRDDRNRLRSSNRRRDSRSDVRRCRRDGRYPRVSDDARDRRVRVRAAGVRRAIDSRREADRRRRETGIPRHPLPGRALAEHASGDALRDPRPPRSARARRRRVVDPRHRRSLLPGRRRSRS